MTMGEIVDNAGIFAGSPSFSQQSDDSSSLRSALTSPVNNQKGETKVNQQKPKTAKKRVTFPVDDADLCAIREIPRHSDSPLSEELEPCDPDRLLEEMGSMKVTDSFSKGKYGFSKSSGRTLDLVSQITGITSFGNFNRNANKNNRHIGSIQNSMKQSLYKGDGRTGVMHSKYTDPNSERTKRRDKRSHGHRRVKSADDVDTLKTKTHKIVERKLSSAKPNGNGRADGAKSRVHQVSKDQRVKFLGDTNNIARSPSLTISRTKDTISLDLKGLHTGEPLLQSSRVMQSPYNYRQSATANRNSQFFTKPSEPSVGLETSGKTVGPQTKVEPNFNRIGGESKVTNSKTQRYYAWHMANQMSGSPLPELETPCISPMWSVKNNNVPETTST